MEITRIDVDTPGGELLAVAAYLAVLAYPESHRKRDRAVLAVLAYVNRAARHMGKPLSPIASELFKDVKKKAQGEILGTGQKGVLPRIHRRLVAANAAAYMLLTRSSLHDIAKRYAGNESYFLHTVWTESKPVLHLALALRGVLMGWADDGRPVWVQLVANPSWVRDAMKSAENWRVGLSIPTTTPEFLRYLDPDAFVRLLPAECADSPTTH